MNRRLIILMVALALGVVGSGQLTRVLATQAQASNDTYTWLQVNSDGFGDSQNGQIPSLAVFNGYLYAGTQNYTHHPESSEIWRTSNGTTWEKVDDRLTSGSAALIVFQDYLYSGSWGDANGGNIWRSQNGIDWTNVITDGFSDVNNGIARFAVYCDTLYVGTWNATTGTEIWRTTDGLHWGQFGVGGLDGNPNNGGAIASEEFDGYLYWGIGNWTTGAQLWRTDGITITPVITNGFGITENASVSSLSVFNGNLYAGLWNSNDVQIWRSGNGVDWTHIVDADFGSPGAHMANALEVYNGMLYLVVQEDDNGLQVWRTSNGADWEQIGFAGFGDSNNTWSYWDNATIVFKGKLYIASRNTATGGEIWQLTQPLHEVFLPLVKK